MKTNKKSKYLRKRFSFIITLFIVIFVVFIYIIGKNPIKTTKIRENSYSGFNVILIIIDTLRADHLGCYGYSRSISPNIDLLAKKSFIFYNTYSASSWTRSAIASIVSSKLPTEHKITSENKKEILRKEFFTIQEFFNQMNYTTAAFYTNPHLNFGVTQNFSYKYFKGNEESNLVYDKVISWLDNNSNNNFFLLVHNMDPHDPYDFHPGFSSTPKRSRYRTLGRFFSVRKNGAGSTCENPGKIIILNKTQLAEMIANYDGEIKFLDYNLGRFFDYLRRKSLLDNTIIIFTSDHGEEFLEHGGYWHGCTLYNELIHVPLMIYIPHVRGRKVMERVSTIDIFPTLISLFDNKSLSEYNLSGVSLLPLMNNEPFKEKEIFSATAFRGALKYSVIRGDYKLITYANGTIIGFYNIKEDKKESKNLANVNSDLLDLINHIQKTTKIENKKNFKTKNIDKETLKQLKSLGYLT